MLYVLGYASKKGLEILDAGGEIRVISSTKIGNMFWPDPLEMGEFIATLNSSDTVLSPSGSNQSYLAGAFRKGSEVFWINPARVVDEFGKTKENGPSVLLELWEKKPEIFYEYLASDFQVAQLAVLYSGWLKMEREKVALGNALSQTLTREMESFRFLASSKKDWVGEKTQNAVLRFKASARKGKVKLPKEVIKEYGKHFQEEMEAIYDISLEGDTKEIERVQKKLLESEMTSVTDLLFVGERRVESLLKSLPHNDFFEGLKGVGTKSKAGVLVFIGNPLKFSDFPHLNSYVGMRVVEGQGIRRADPVNPEDLRFEHEAHRVLCFDFGDKAHFHQGFFQDIYYAYKLHQHLIYWPLIEMTGQVFKYWDKKEVSQALIKKWLRELRGMVPELPMLQRSKRRQKMIADLEKNPNWPNFRKLFSREKGGGDIQMPPIRIENQVKRLNGITLARITYYRWLEFLKRPLPLKEDFIYQRQCKSIGANGRVYDHQVHLQYYYQKVKELQRMGKTLPESAWQKFPSELYLKE